LPVRVSEGAATKSSFWVIKMQFYALLADSYSSTAAKFTARKRPTPWCFLKIFAAKDFHQHPQVNFLQGF